MRSNEMTSDESPDDSGRDRRDPPDRPDRDASPEYYVLSEADTDPTRVRKEREKARKLKKSQWWLTRLNAGICHYCQGRFKPSELTMDHIVPIARGGSSSPGNVVPACKPCNRDKKLDTPVDELLRKMK